MGYTHYWNGSLVCEDAVWNQMVDEFLAVWLRARVKLSGADGTGLAILNKHGVCFNGQGERDSHETFSLDRASVNMGFCKTARKPYDILVCAMLIIIKHHLPAFEVGSDGNEADWHEAIDLCRQVLGYGVYPCRPEASEPAATASPMVVVEQDGIIVITRPSVID